jgi:hypothetical protein
MKSRDKNEAPLLFREHMKELGLTLLGEYHFHPNRKWRFDFIVARERVKRQVAFEIEGGIWSRGRHVRPQGFQDDLDKYNAATALGWRVFRFSTEDVFSLKAKHFVRDWLNQEQP